MNRALADEIADALKGMKQNDSMSSSESIMSASSPADDNLGRTVELVEA